MYNKIGVSIPRLHRSEAQLMLLSGSSLCLSLQNIQSTNWQTMRFKPPPPDSPIGWRVEFRPTEVHVYTQLEFLAATKQLYEWFSPSVRLSVCPSVCLSVRPSVCLSHLFDYVPIILSSWNFQELLPVTKVTSMQKVKVRGQRSRSQRSRPKFSFPDCNSSLNSHMMMKWYI